MMNLLSSSPLERRLSSFQIHRPPAPPRVERIFMTTKTLECLPLAPLAAWGGKIVPTTAMMITEAWRKKRIQTMKTMNA